MYTYICNIRHKHITFFLMQEYCFVSHGLKHVQHLLVVAMAWKEALFKRCDSCPFSQSASFPPMYH